MNKSKSNEVSVAPKIERVKFPSLDNVLDEFISHNNLIKPHKVTSTESRGLLVFWDNGDHINLYSYQDDSTTNHHQQYGLQGRIDGQNVSLLGGIKIPICNKLDGKIYRDDKDKQYVFLGMSNK